MHDDPAPQEFVHDPHVALDCITEMGRQSVTLPVANEGQTMVLAGHVRHVGTIDVVLSQK